MKLLYKPVSGPGAYVVIYDDSETIAFLTDKPITPGSVPTWEPEFTGVDQQDDMFTVPNQSTPRFRQALGNVQGTVQVELHIGYNTFDDAAASELVFTQLMQQLIHFQYVVGATIKYYPNATIQRYKHKQQGTDVTHTFSFDCDLVQANAP